jgi:membrane AbrB-like protein
MRPVRRLADRRRVRTWLAVVAGAIVASLVLWRLGVSSPSLLGGCLGAAVVAMWLGRRGIPTVQMPRAVRGMAQVVIGAHLGLSITTSALTGVGAGWLVVVGFLLVTVGVCMVAAYAVSRVTPMSTATAQMGMMPGGATVSIAVSDDVGTDPRVVAVMQYSRVYLILVTLPLAAGALSTNGVSGGNAEAGPGARAQLAGVAVVAACLVLTFGFMRLFSFPSGYLLVPLVLSMVAASLLPATAAVPDRLLAVGLGVIGVFVGLQVTVESLRETRDSLPAILTGVVAVIAACGLLGLCLAELLGKSLVDGYLATTPGGVNVILGLATGSDIDLAFVTAAQVLRILTMMVLLPLLGSWHMNRLATDDQ